MMNGNFNYGYYQQGGYVPQGMIYQPTTAKLNMTQGLTPEEQKSLRKSGGFSLDISPEEMKISYCTHRYPDKFATAVDDEGNFICAICGAKFKSFDGNIVEAREAVNRVMDLVETTKMQALNLPHQTIREVFQIVPVLKRLPDLYAQSVNDYKNALGVDSYMAGAESNAFAHYQQMINPMAGNNYYDPAMMNIGGQVYGSQMGYGNPQMMGGMNPQMGYNNPQMMGGMNPQMGYGNPQMMGGQQMFNNQQGGVNPFDSNATQVNNVQAPAQQAAPQATEQVTVTKQLTD